MNDAGTVPGMPWASLLAASLWRASWQGALAITLVALACRAFPALPPWARCWLWRAAYCKLFVALFWATPITLPLLPPSPSLPGAGGEQERGRFGAERFGVRQPAAAFVSIPEDAAVDLSVAKQKRQRAAALQGAPRQSALVSAHSATVLDFRAWVDSRWRDVLPAVLLIWMAGALGSGLGIVRDWRASRSLRREAAPITDGALLTAYAAISRRLGVRHRPRLLASERVGSPVLAGAIRPALLLPPSLMAVLSREELRPVFAHELAHVQRRDLLWAWLPAMGRALFFFHPWLWLARREWCLAHELACDAVAMRALELPSEAYGQVVLKVVARRRSLPFSDPLAVGAAGSYETLRRRFVAMQEIRPLSRRRSLLLGGLVVSAGLFLALPWRVTAQEAPAPSARLSAIPPVPSTDRAPVQVHERPAPPSPVASLRPARHRPEAALSPQHPVVSRWVAPGRGSALRVRVAPSDPKRVVVGDRRRVQGITARVDGEAGAPRWIVGAPVESLLPGGLYVQVHPEAPAPAATPRPVTPPRPPIPPVATPRRLSVGQAPRAETPSAERSETEARRARLQAEDAVREAQRQLERALRDLPDQRRAMEEALRRLPEQDRQMAEARRQLQEALRTLPEHQRQMAAARRQLEDARRRLQETPRRGAVPERRAEPYRGLDEDQRRELERRLGEMRSRLDSALRQSAARRQQSEEARRRGESIRRQVEERMQNRFRAPRAIRERDPARTDPNSARPRRTIEEHLRRLEQLQRELDEQLRRPPRPEAPSAPVLVPQAAPLPPPPRPNPAGIASEA